MAGAKMDRGSRKRLIAALALLIAAVAWLGFYYTSGSADPIPKLTEEEAAALQREHDAEIKRIEKETRVRGVNQPTAPSGS